MHLLSQHLLQIQCQFLGQQVNLQERDTIESFINNKLGITDTEHYKQIQKLKNLKNY